jgi:hypothetical protein
MRGARLIAGLTFALGVTGALVRAGSVLKAWYPTLAATVIHVLLAAAFLVAFGPFFFGHLRGQRRRAWSSAGNLSLLFVLAGVTASGVALLVKGQRGSLPLVHFALSVLVVGALLMHAGTLRPRFKTGGALWGFKLGGILILLSLLVLASRMVSTQGAPAAAQLPLSSVRMAGELPPYDAASMSPESCAQCHAQVVADWKQSLHAVADSEIVYARVVAEFRREHGVEASNWCAGCHSPLRMARGQLNIKVADVDQPNVDCVTCHSIRQIHQPRGDLNFDMAVKPAAGYGAGYASVVSNRLLLMQPDAHRERWNGSLPRGSELCGACHRQTLPEFLTGSKDSPTIQDTYGEWQRSRFNSDNPAQRRTCQDCHMPENRGLTSLLVGGGRRHLFAGASVDVARLEGSRTALREHRRLLASAAAVALAVEGCNSQGIALLAKVTNYGAGHNLPTGVTDLREVWLEVTAKDEAGRVVYQSGAVSSDGTLDPDATRFGVTLGDAERKPVHLHDIVRVRLILEDTTIRSGETRDVRYVLPLRNLSRGTVQVRLLYRAVPQNFLNHFMTSDLRFQVVEMASASQPVETSGPCAASGDVARTRPPE